MILPYSYTEHKNAAFICYLTRCRFCQILCFLLSVLLRRLNICLQNVLLSIENVAIYDFKWIAWLKGFHLVDIGFRIPCVRRHIYTVIEHHQQNKAEEKNAEAKLSVDIYLIIYTWFCCYCHWCVVFRSCYSVQMCNTFVCSFSIQLYLFSLFRCFFSSSVVVYGVVR